MSDFDRTKSFYAGLIARERGKTLDEAADDAARHMERAVEPVRV